MSKVVDSVMQVIDALVEKYGYPAASGFVRFARTWFVGIVTMAVAYAMNHLASLDVSPLVQFLVFSVLVALDKWAREARKAAKTEG